MSPTIKKILSVTANVLVWLLIAVAVFFIYFSLSSKENGGVPKVFGYSPLVVQTDSMNGDKSDSFTVGDLIIVSEPKEGDLKVGAVISFWDLIDGTRQLNSHRIVRIEGEGSNVKYETQGDKPGAFVDETLRSRGDIVGVYRTKIGGAGKALDFLSSKWGFLICLVVPLAAFFLWRVIKLVMVAMQYKDAKKNEEEAEKAEEENARLEEIARQMAAKMVAEGTVAADVAADAEPVPDDPPEIENESEPDTEPAATPETENSDEIKSV